MSLSVDAFISFRRLKRRIVVRQGQSRLCWVEGAEFLALSRAANFMVRLLDTRRLLFIGGGCAPLRGTLSPSTCEASSSPLLSSCVVTSTSPQHIHLTIPFNTHAHIPRGRLAHIVLWPPAYREADCTDFGQPTRPVCAEQRHGLLSLFYHPISSSWNSSVSLRGAGRVLRNRSLNGRVCMMVRCLSCSSLAWIVLQPFLARGTVSRLPRGTHGSVAVRPNGELCAGLAGIQ